MEKFCEDIGVEPENVVMLVLAYRMNARQMGFFTLSEWLKGFSELQCDSISKIQQKLEYLRNQLNDPYTFKGIYRYAYDFARVCATLSVSLSVSDIHIMGINYFCLLLLIVSLKFFAGQRST